MEHFNSTNPGSKNAAIRETKFNPGADLYRWAFKGKTRAENATPSGELKNVPDGKKKRGFHCKEKTSPGIQYTTKC